MKEKILEIKNLTAGFKYDGVWTKVIHDVSYDVYRGEILGVVGESGSGKSVTVKNVLRLFRPESSRVFDGEILFNGRDLLKVNKKEICSIRGNDISMIFQEPMTSLNPVYTCGDQIAETLIFHRHMSRSQAWERGTELLRWVGIPMPELRMKAYPHELSGGMRQRVMIAMALACDPQILIADEPTTALDPTIQAQILALLKQLQAQTGMSIVYITHDLGVVAELCDRVAVMYAGRIMEVAPVKELFKNPKHPYTQGLMKAMPRLDMPVGQKLYSIEGNVPHCTEKMEGCPFHPRCSKAMDVCRQCCPDVTDTGDGHLVRCHLMQKEDV